MPKLLVQLSTPTSAQRLVTITSSPKSGDGEGPVAVCAASEEKSRDSEVSNDDPTVRRSPTPAVGGAGKRCQRVDTTPRRSCADEVYALFRFTHVIAVCALLDDRCSMLITRAAAADADGEGSVIRNERRGAAMVLSSL